MPPGRWTTPTQRAYLDLQLPVYIRRQAEGKLFLFWGPMEEGWFHRFPEQAVLGLPLPSNRTAAPLSDGDMARLGTAIKKRQGQLISWFRREYKKSRTVTPAVSLIKRRAKRTSGHRVHQAIEIFQKRNKLKIRNEMSARGFDALNEAARVAARSQVGVAVSGGTTEPESSGEETSEEQEEDVKETREEQEAHVKVSRAERMRLRVEVVSDLWKNASREERAAVDEELAREKAEKLRAQCEEDEKDKQSDQTPEQYQQGIDALEGLFKDVHKESHERAGWVGFTIVGGPTPRHNSDLSVKIICIGETPHGNSFQDACVDFDKDIVGRFEQFLKVVYSFQERDSRALKKPDAVGETTPSPQPEDEEIVPSPVKTRKPPKRIPKPKKKSASATTAPKNSTPPSAPVIQPSTATFTPTSGCSAPPDLGRDAAPSQVPVNATAGVVLPAAPEPVFSQDSTGPLPAFSSAPLPPFSPDAMYRMPTWDSSDSQGGLFTFLEEDLDPGQFGLDADWGEPGGSGSGSGLGTSSSSSSSFSFGFGTGAGAGVGSGSWSQATDWSRGSFGAGGFDRLSSSGVGGSTGGGMGVGPSSLRLPSEPDVFLDTVGGPVRPPPRPIYQGASLGTRLHSPHGEYRLSGLFAAFHGTPRSRTAAAGATTPASVRRKLWTAAPRSPGGGSGFATRTAAVLATMAGVAAPGASAHPLPPQAPTATPSALTTTLPVPTLPVLMARAPPPHTHALPTLPMPTLADELPQSWPMAKIPGVGRRKGRPPKTKTTSTGDALGNTTNQLDEGGRVPVRKRGSKASEDAGGDVGELGGGVAAQPATEEVGLRYSVTNNTIQLDRQVKARKAKELADKEAAEKQAALADAAAKGYQEIPNPGQNGIAVVLTGRARKQRVMFDGSEPKRQVKNVRPRNPNAATEKALLARASNGGEAKKRKKGGDPTNAPGAKKRKTR